MMNLREIMNSKGSGLDKINILSELKLKLEKQISNDIPLCLNLNYIFTTDLEVLTPNNQGKEVDLAIKILELTQRGNRKYNIDLTKKVSTKIFINFFNQYIGTSTYELVHRIGCHIYKSKHTATLKALIAWSNKLYNNKIIDVELLNKFLEYLESISEEN